ncbi:type III-B CRISPR-associated protein Cas10/Cmr2 [Lusitaniella coriacea]|uniref:type III-B CRISPR-associated protein Cas10/Cmr2 n=1 Tax=Lusitaniella coriacea TaxID=1983105 RepID=UPI003CF00A7F
MCQAFWQAKIQGLLHNINPDVLNSLLERGNAPLNRQQLEAILQRTPAGNHLAHLIAEASDRAVLNVARPFPPNLSPTATHLLSGERLTLTLEGYNSPLGRLRNGSSNGSNPDAATAEETELDPRELQQIFWWLWRCLPEVASQEFGEVALLIPAADVLPDASLWSHASMTAAMAGALMGYRSSEAHSPHIATFSFSPIQELIKASRKMRDFWAGSWVLHYLSAKVCWKLAQKYGPDSLIYPSLFQQPLIDRWLLSQHPDWTAWIDEPREGALLTAGFPNVITILLPKDSVRAAMQMARQTLLDEWKQVGHLVFEELRERSWTRELEENSATWKGWLQNQWQTYWTALPISVNSRGGEDAGTRGRGDVEKGGDDGETGRWGDAARESYEQLGLTCGAIPEDRETDLKDWRDALNRLCNITGKQGLFKLKEETKEDDIASSEIAFVRAVYQQNSSIQLNVGSWWPYVFDELRRAAGAVKGSRSWKIPTAFLPRSTVSGVGSVVYPQHPERRNGRIDPNNCHVTEGETARYWQRDGGLFSGIEELNATEVLKRGLHQVLFRLLGEPEEPEASDRFKEAYPDLSSGVAGWLRTHPEHRNYFATACHDIAEQFPWTQNPNAEGASRTRRDRPPALLPWGIPWVDEAESNWLNPRLLNAGWLIDDYHPPATDENIPFTPREQKEHKQAKSRELRQFIGEYFKPGNNPTDWYVIAAGDGDGMSKWLRGDNLKNYGDYMLEDSTMSDSAIQEAFDNLKKLKKRMGPSSHNAFSRALLDFSNQLVPYLTEQRYAGRLIYSGGDDVLAYTNLWEWDRWLWDIRECFRGARDPMEDAETWRHGDAEMGRGGCFGNTGDYWQWSNDSESPQDASGRDWQPRLANRPLFTMGQHKSSLSFGVVIAHHSVPLAIALENLWEAESGAKGYEYGTAKKDAVQVRVLFGNGNILQATSRFAVFNQWQQLLNAEQWGIESALFEQATQVWSQHPAPVADAIAPWTKAFCDRRDSFQNHPDLRDSFQQTLAAYLSALYSTTPENKRDREIQNWLKLAAFMLRNRNIQPRRES